MVCLFLRGEIGGLEAGRLCYLETDIRGNRTIWLEEGLCLCSWSHVGNSTLRRLIPVQDTAQYVIMSETPLEQGLFPSLREAFAPSGGLWFLKLFEADVVEN